MSEYEENFRKWFVDILNDLIERKRDTAGAILLMVSFPLLERYLRAKVGGNGQRQYEKLANLFPKLGDAKKAEEFWHVYRDALLHQVTLNRSGDAWRMDEHAEAVELVNERFVLNPAKFTEQVLWIIRDDFAAFATSPLVSRHSHLGVQGTNTTAIRSDEPHTYQDRFK